MEYELRLMQTEAATGYFACVPARKTDLENMLAYICEHPLDEFMHKYLLETLGKSDESALKNLMNRNNPAIQALIYEICLLSRQFAELKKAFDSSQIALLSHYSPMIYIRSSLMADQSAHIAWNDIFEANLINHKPLPSPDNAGLPILFPDARLDSVSVKDIYQDMKTISVPPYSRPDPADTAKMAIEKLKAINVLSGAEMRHHSSLSLCAMLRQWQMRISVKSGRHDYTLSGTQTAYGKGLDLDSARVSYAMEIAERCSSFASFEADAVVGYLRDYPLIYSDYNHLIQNGKSALNPESLLPDTPYENEPLYWLEGEDTIGSPIWIPAQCVFLFSNPDEISLFASPGSTGLASGNTIEEAKVSALLEVFERDSESLGFYDPSRCFRLDGGFPRLAALLGSYREKGVDVIFQDITSEMGIPAYKCFVIAPDGEIVKGCGAHLDGRRAILSALTETPWSYPYSPFSAKGPEDLPMIRFEDLPDYSTRHPATDLQMLEKLLTANNHPPVYADLRRKDLEIPVVRVIVPGMETSSERDRHSRISPGRFAAYLRLYNR